MYCEQAEMKLAQYLFDELSEVERIELESHLDACDACHEKVGDMRITVGLLKEGFVAEPSPRMSEAKRTSLMAQLNEPASQHDHDLQQDREMQADSPNQSFKLSFPITPQGRAILTAAGLVFAVILTAMLMPNSGGEKNGNTQYAVRFEENLSKDGGFTSSKSSIAQGGAEDDTWLDETTVTRRTKTTSPSVEFRTQSNLNGVFLELPKASAAPTENSTIARIDGRAAMTDYDTKFDSPIPAAADLPIVGSTFTDQRRSHESITYSTQPESLDRLALLDDSKSTGRAVPRRYRDSTKTYFDHGQPDGQIVNGTSGTKLGVRSREGYERPIEVQMSRPGESTRHPVPGITRLAEEKRKNTSATRGGSEKLAFGPQPSGETMTDDLYGGRSTRWYGASGNKTRGIILGGTTKELDERIAQTPGDKGSSHVTPATDPASIAAANPVQPRSLYEDHIHDDNGESFGTRLGRDKRFGDDDALKSLAKLQHKEGRVDHLTTKESRFAGQSGLAGDKMALDNAHPSSEKQFGKPKPGTGKSHGYLDAAGRAGDGVALADGTQPNNQPAVTGVTRLAVENEYSFKDKFNEEKPVDTRPTTGGALARDEVQLGLKGKDASVRHDSFWKQDQKQGQNQGEGQDPGQGRGPGFGDENGNQTKQDWQNPSRLSKKPSSKDWSSYQYNREFDDKDGDGKVDPNALDLGDARNGNRPELLAKLESLNQRGGEGKSQSSRIDDYEMAFRLKQSESRSRERVPNTPPTSVPSPIVTGPGNVSGSYSTDAKGGDATDGYRSRYDHRESAESNKFQAPQNGERLLDRSEYLDTTLRTRTAINDLKAQNDQLHATLSDADEITRRPATITTQNTEDKELPDNLKKAIELEATNNDLVTARDTLRRQVKLNQETIASLEAELLEAKQMAAIPKGITRESEESVSLFAVPKPAAATHGRDNNQSNTGPSRKLEKNEADEPDDNSPLPPSSNFKAGPVNPWTRTEVDRQSTFALDVDTASYTLARKYIRKGYLPPAGAVRMEEFVNAFDYNYPEKTGQTFTVFATGAPAPFAPTNQHNIKLLKVGVRGKVIGRDKLKPAHVVFVVDTSGSMAREDRLPLVKYSLTQLVRQLHAGGEGRPADRVSLVSYGSDVHVLLDRVPATQANQIVAAIESLQPTGATNLLKGVATGYSLARQAFKAGQINRIILCSDGIATLGETEADAMLEHVDHYRKQGISFTSVGFGAGTYNDSLMEKLANKGDGTYIYVDSKREARRVFADELTSTLQMIAKDAKIQVEFNPHRVHRYRLIGYENRAIADKDFRNDTIDAGEVGSGQSSTALYEIELHGDASASIGTVFVRYQNIDTEKVEEISYALSNDMMGDRKPSTDPRFYLAACAAEFAELMRQSEHARDGNLEQLEFTMYQVVQQLPLDQKARELLNLIKKARTLPRAP